MTTVPTESVRGQRHELAPLNDFYRRAGRAMPVIRFCAGGELPIRKIFVHE